jgi:hypothetical protein
MILLQVIRIVVAHETFGCVEELVGELAQMPHEEGEGEMEEKGLWKFYT